MPFKSKAQERFIRGVANGMKPAGRGTGMTREQAKKFIAHSGRSRKDLPEHAPKKGK